MSLLAVIVVAGAVYVVADNRGSGGPPSASTGSGSAPTPATTSPPRSAGTSGTAPATRTRTSAAPTSAGSGAGSSGSTSARTPVVAFLGDDWTSGAGATTRDDRFTTVLSRAADLTERNFGADGTGYGKRTSDAGNYASRVDDVIAAAPDIVVVSGGRNDVYLDQATVAVDARNLFEALAAGLPKARIIAVAPFWGDSAEPQQLTAIASSVRQAVESVGGTYLDVADPILGHPEFMADDADPNDDGYAAVAAALRPRFERLS